MAKVMCAKYKKELTALEKAPFPGPDGVEILENVSSAAWDEWLSIQTMIINENRLNLMDADARKFLAEQRNKFLFEGEEIDMPNDFIDPSIPNLK
jgi:Fe-S cluster biosynthesis and repair protein YggX